MENKLRMEMEALPGPDTTFEELAAISGEAKPRRLRRRVFVLIAAVLALLLCGMGWAKTSMRYGMWVLYSSHGWSDVEWAAKKMDIELPETMDGAPFAEFWIYGHVPQGGSFLQALVSPLYKPISVDYGWNRVETETYPGGELRSESHWVEDEFGLSFGTTENELWRYYFQIDEQGNWTGCEVPESYRVMEYKGICLQMGDTVFYDSVMGCNRYIRWVHWVDEEKQVAFSISESDYTDPDRVVECAKAVIDLNME